MRTAKTSRPEVRLVAGAAAVVAVHTLLDAFVAPQRGTSWNDHLSAGLAPLVALAVGLLLYTRARPGVRAALAAALGVLSLEGAGLASADVFRASARPSDWTGFLLAPVGVALCGLAAVLLWASRSRRGRLYLRRSALAVGALVLAFVVVAPVGVALYATHRPRAEVRPAELGAPYRDVTVRTADGLDLAAWYVPSRNGAAIVSFPTRIGKVAQARMLVRHGFGVLLLDMRGYEGSEGSPNAFGWGATKDIDAAVAWLRRQPDVGEGRIGGIGFSVGGEQMLEAAADNPGLHAVVSEGAGERSVRETLVHGPRGWLAVPTALMQTSAIAALSGTAPPPSLEDVVSRIAPRAVFLIYAGRGVGSEELNADFYRAAKKPKAIWKIPEAHHVGGLDARPAEYERRIVGFLDRFLLGNTQR
jgi:fermentation-respiration switch protein FrsA (DUF1100 family)